MADRLSSVDHELLAHLLAHRVMITPQLITLVNRPERTVDYRLSRLRTSGAANRTRPSASSGSPPFFWWLSRYDTLSWKEIASMPVAEVMAQQSHLYLWVPNALVAEGLTVLEAWVVSCTISYRLASWRSEADPVHPGQS